MKRLVAILLVVVLVLCLVPAASAASSEANDAAEALYKLGLFKGVGTNSDGSPIFDLDRAPSRNEAITMLVRLLGKEVEAQAVPWSNPFTDVVDWAKPYVGYAYANKLTSGTSSTTFGGSDIVLATQYITFCLRALGYESGTDFAWDAAWVLSDQIGMTDGRYNKNTTEFTRGDVAIISYSTLSMKLKGSEKTLLETLYEQKVISDEQSEAAGFGELAKVKFTLTKAPVTITNTSIKKDGTVAKTVYKVNSLKVKSCDYAYTQQNIQGFPDAGKDIFKVVIELDWTFVSTDAPQNPAKIYTVNRSYAIYESNGEQRDRKTIGSNFEVGGRYVTKIDFYIAEGTYSFLLQQEVTDFRLTGLDMNKFYDVY